MYWEIVQTYVLMIITTTHQAITKIGDVGVVTGDYTRSGSRPFVEFERVGRLHIDEDLYELEEIVNSPLYKALN